MIKPISGFTVGVEMDYGRLTVNDGRRRSDTRVRLAVQFDLVK
jgi:hypothetical protein